LNIFEDSVFFPHNVLLFEFSFGEFKFKNNNSSLSKLAWWGAMFFFFSWRIRSLTIFFSENEKKKTRNFCDFHGFVAPF
jgi:hypothetical protein